MLGESESASGMSGIGPQIEKICAVLEATWFPANPNLIASLQEKIRSRGYGENVELLMADVCSDFSLFAYSAREISRIIGTGENVLASCPDPFKLFRHAGYAQLSEAIMQAPANISEHFFGHDLQLQGQQLYGAMMTAGVAETLSQAEDIDPETAFSCALFRQLGLTLVAWSYPHVFARALTNLKSGQSLDVVLGRVLGFAPSILGLNLARKWRMSQDLLYGMGASAEAESQETQLVAERLRHVCEIGEALARASDPEHYPNAHAEWASARGEIELMLGRSGMEVIFQNVEKHCGLYKQFCPELLPQRLVHQINAEIGHSFGRACYERNTHIPKCPVFLQEQLRELYARIDGFSIKSELIQTLVRQSAFAVGFTRGCVYLLDPERRVLCPRLRFGDLREFMERPRDYSLVKENDTPVVEAFNSSAVLISGNAVLAMTGALGNVERIGVFYLEIPRVTQQARRESAIDCFCAISQALSDCLTIQ